MAVRMRRPDQGDWEDCQSVALREPGQVPARASGCTLEVALSLGRPVRAASHGYYHR
jgi:hypothetical protein